MSGRGQALPLALGLGLLVLGGALAVGALGLAQLAKARAQTAADTAALSAGRRLRELLPALAALPRAAAARVPAEALAAAAAPALEASGARLRSLRALPAGGVAADRGRAGGPGGRAGRHRGRRVGAGRCSPWPRRRPAAGGGVPGVGGRPRRPPSTPPGRTASPWSGAGDAVEPGPCAGGPPLARGPRPGVRVRAAGRPLALPAGLRPRARAETGGARRPRRPCPGGCRPGFGGSSPRAASAAALPPILLAALLQAESGFDPRAVSPAGALGIAQFMPATAAGVGLRDPFDPVRAVPAAARLLAGHLRAFGSVPLALAAYNAGPGAVRRFGGVPPYRETQGYVARILALTGGLDAVAAGGGVVLIRAGAALVLSLSPGRGRDPVIRRRAYTRNDVRTARPCASSSRGCPTAPASTSTATPPTGCCTSARPSRSASACCRTSRRRCARPTGATPITAPGAQRAAPEDGRPGRADRAVEVFVTGSESEALILEANLVKRHRPPFNVRLRDDKSYPYIGISLDEEYPRVYFTRERHRRDRALLRAVLERLQGARDAQPDREDLPEPPLRGAASRGGRPGVPCLDYHIKRCLAPCVGYISKEDYRALIDQIIAFLSGRYRGLERELEEQMRAAAAAQEFERAAALRNRLAAVRHLMERQCATAEVGGHGRRARRRDRGRRGQRAGAAGARRRAAGPPVVLPRRRRAPTTRRRC